MYLIFFSSNVPYSDSLIVGTAGDKLATWTDSSHSDPLPMSSQSFDTVACCDLPYFDCFISRCADDEITLWHKRH